MGPAIRNKQKTVLGAPAEAHQQDPKSGIAHKFARGVAPLESEWHLFQSICKSGCGRTTSTGAGAAPFVCGLRRYPWCNGAVFLVKDIKCRQADVEDFLLTENNFVTL